MADDDRIVDLLEEILWALKTIGREQLEPHYRSVAQGLGDGGKSLLRAVKTAKQWETVALLDGTRSQAEVARIGPLDSGNLSRFLTRLRDAKLLTDGGGGPRVIFTPREVEALRALHG